ncbi:MAG: hypothetical protein JSR55_12780 [Proteobacteria bacterium]|nr:hypothetical protein [Pseudomonadota bacterium]
MKPEIDKILETTAMQMMMQIAPQLPPGYTQNSTGLLTMLLNFCAQEYENGAEMRASENRELRNLLAELEASVEDVRLRVKLGAVMGERDASLKISDLNYSNAELKKLLIDVQTYLETRSDDQAKLARREIWAVLKGSAKQRLLKLPGM